MFAAQAKVIFDSRDSRFKSPSGAVKAGTAIHLSLLLSRTLAGRRISLVMIDDATHETADWQMEPGEEDLITEEYRSFCVDIVPPHRGFTGTIFAWTANPAARSTDAILTPTAPFLRTGSRSAGS